MLREDYIQDTAKTLQTINYQIAELSRMKEELEKRLAATLEHKDEGQSTYIEGRYKIVVKTGFNYTLDREEYDSIGSRLPSQFDPVTKSIKYDINKKIMRDVYTYGAPSDIELLEQIIKKKPAKLSVTIGSSE